MGRDHETVFTLEATPVKFGAGRRGRRRLGAQAARRQARDAGDGPRRGPRSGSPSGCASSSRRRASRSSSTTARAWSRRIDSLPGRRRLRARREASTASSRSAAARAWTPRRWPNLITTHPAPVMDYVNPPVGEGKKPPSPLKPASRDPDHLRHRLGGHHRRRARHPGPQAQDRHLAPLPAPDAGDRRPRAHADAARRGHLLGRPRRRLPRRGVLPLPDRSTSARGPRRPTTARPTRAPTRSPTSGRPRRWSTAARTCAARSPTREDTEARGFMMLGATMAGVGFGSAGVHIPHACAYPIAGLKHEYQPPGYPTTTRSSPTGTR